MNKTAETVAAMTEAQKRRVLEAWYASCGWRLKNASGPLQRMEVTNGCRLTAHGQAVRALLLENSK